MAKELFCNIIKQVPAESYKRFKIDYDEKNNINITETTKMTNEYNEKNKRIQKYSKILQKYSKSIFYSISNLSRALLNKAKKSRYDKDIVFVNL